MFPNKKQILLAKKKEKNERVLACTRELKEIKNKKNAGEITPEKALSLVTNLQKKYSDILN